MDAEFQELDMIRYETYCNLLVKKWWQQFGSSGPSSSFAFCDGLFFHRNAKMFQSGDLNQELEDLLGVSQLILGWR